MKVVPRWLGLFMLACALPGCEGCDDAQPEVLPPFVGDWNDVDPPEVFDPGDDLDNGCGYYGYGGDCPESALDCRETPCVHGECVDDGEGGVMCACERGYGGALCNTCAEGFVPEDGRCIEQMSMNGHGGRP